MILALFQRPCGSLKLRQIEERKHVQTDRECELDAAAAETHGIDTQGARAACGSGARAAHLHGDEKYRREEEASTGLQQPLEPTRAAKCQLSLHASSSTTCSSINKS